MVEGHHRRVHAGLDLARVALRVGDELDRIPELAGVPKIDRLDPFDAFAVDLAWSHLDLVGDRTEDRQLVSGVETADVVCWIGFGEPCRLRLGHSLRK